MKTRKILYSLLILLVITGCVSYGPKYKDPYNPEKFQDKKDIVKSFYLIGDDFDQHWLLQSSQTSPSPIIC